MIAFDISISYLLGTKFKIKSINYHNLTRSTMLQEKVHKLSLHVFYSKHLCMFIKQPIMENHCIKNGQQITPTKNVFRMHQDDLEDYGFLSKFLETSVSSFNCLKKLIFFQRSLVWMNLKSQIKCAGSDSLALWVIGWVTRAICLFK